MGRCSDNWLRDAGDDDLPEEDLPADEPCSHCGRVYDAIEDRCPECGEYRTEEGRPPWRPKWFVLAGWICLFIALWWIYSIALTPQLPPKP